MPVLSLWQAQRGGLRFEWRTTAAAVLLGRLAPSTAWAQSLPAWQARSAAHNAARIACTPSCTAHLQMMVVQPSVSTDGSVLWRGEQACAQSRRGAATQSQRVSVTRAGRGRAARLAATQHNRSSMHSDCSATIQTQQQHKTHRTMALRCAILRVPRARQVVTTAGRPSGIAATASATAILK